MMAENVELVFTEGALKEVAKVSAAVNKTVENIGARRLYSVIERIVELISFEAPEHPGERFEITEEYVKQRTAELVEGTTGANMRKYIL